MKRALICLALLLCATSGWAQSPVTVTGLIIDAGNNPATSGYVQFDIIPKASSIHYFISGFGTITQTTQCGINGVGIVLNLALSGPCTVWGNDLINPANTQYKVTFAPNGNITNVVSGECLTGSTYNLNLPVFCPILQITPQNAIVRSNPFQVNIIPPVANTFNVGSPLLQYAAVYASQFIANGVVLTSSPIGLGTINNWTNTNNFAGATNLNGGGNFTGTFTGNGTFNGGITLISPIVSTPTFNRTGSWFLKNLAGSYNVTWSNTFNGTVNIPDPGAGGANFVFDIATQTLTNKSISGSEINSGTVPAAQLPATTSNCTGSNFTQGLNAGGTPICAAAPGFTITQVDLTAQGGNIGLTPLLTPGANGYYRISAYMPLTRAATTSSALPNVVISWTDVDSNTAEAFAVLNGAPTANTVGTLNFGTGNAASQDIYLFAKSGVTVQYQVTGYTSVGGTSMQYALHIRVEGPF